MAIAFAVSLGFLAALLFGMDLAAVSAHARAADWAVLAWSVPLKGIGFACMAARTRIMLAPTRPLSWSDAVRSTLVGFAGNNLLPLRGGDLLRIAWLARAGATPAGVTASVATERLVDLVVLLALFVGTLAAGVVEIADRAVLAGWVIASGLALAGAVVASRHPEAARRVLRACLQWTGPAVTSRVEPVAGRFLDGLSALRTARGVVAVFALAAAIVATWLGGVWLWIVAFDLDLPWYAPAVILAFATFGQMIPSAPGAIGTWHYFVTLALTLLGVQDSLAVGVAVVGHAIGIVPWTALSVVGLGIGSLRPTRT